MQCSKCSSDNTQRLEVVYESGTQNINTRSNSVGVGFSGKLGVGGATTKTQGTSQTTIAQKASPPSKKPFKLGIAAAIFGMFFLGSGSLGAVAFGVAIIAGGGYMIYSAMTYNKTEWPPLYKYWQESWLCNKCGSIYHQP
jgi:hypothetical protein